ncbi:dihydrodipicolinate synthase family protein [Maribacter sp. HTCC2170]|uniref:dihydrodipicolinate synthase family protein n=1 Tax=Maribacter sp. (strain HTCC2170 / KCCM 42371) TaxID=313603 RepID=UPI00006BD1D9|nr:dihydrodipicolinate synthase family protein [Maribacter sp. HTCC2170]EAR02404.1 putative N-acetylneuraminate lyase (sialic acid lyase) [Maribacter sp. HTCC2170]
MNIKNLVAATYTPMHKDTSLNLDIIKTYGDFLKRNKVSGAFINGTTGDFASLTIQERKLIVEAWSANRADDFLLINHVGHTSLKVAMDLTSHSADKVDAIGALAPFYFKVNSVDKLVEYCKNIASCAPGLPFYYYHIPDLSGAQIKMIDFVKIASKQIPNFAGLKFTKNDLIDYKYCFDYDSNKYNILFGVDEMFIASLPLGTKGWVGSTYNHLAPLYYKVKEAFENDDYQMAADLQTKAMLFVDTLNNKGGYNGVAKGFMKTLGIDCGPSRFPHTTLKDGDYVEITKELDAIGLTPYFGK